MRTAGFDQQSLSSAADFINTLADAQGVTVDQLAHMDSKSLDDLASKTLSDVDASEEDKKVQLAAMEALNEYGKQKAGAPSNSAEDQMMRLFRDSSAQMTQLKGQVEKMSSEFGQLKKRRAAMEAAQGQDKNAINISLKYSGLAAGKEGEKEPSEEDKEVQALKESEESVEKEVEAVEEEIVKEVPNPSHLKVPIVIVHQISPNPGALMVEANREKNDPKSVMAKMKKQAEAVDPQKLLEFHQNQLAMTELLKDFYKDDADRTKQRLQKYRALEEEFGITPPSSEGETKEKESEEESGEENESEE